jgi:hypothetical protein
LFNVQFSSFSQEMMYDDDDVKYTPSIQILGASNQKIFFQELETSKHDTSHCTSSQAVPSAQGSSFPLLPTAPAAETRRAATAIGGALAG